MNSSFSIVFILLLLVVSGLFSEGALAECKQDSVGYVWCSRFPAGGIEQDSTGNIKCGRGECLRDKIGTVYCSKIEGGGAARDSLGFIKCLGGCEPGDHANCVRADN